MGVASYCGLDFGTSNSTLGLIRDGMPALAKLEGEQVTIPSAMFFDFEEKSAHFGRDAIATYMEGGEGRMMRALKSILGTSTMDEKTWIGTKRLPFSDILGLFLSRLKEKAETQTDTPLSQVVMGRPVHFVDGDEGADKQAEATLRAIAADVGFKEIEFEYEPVAAARDFQSRASREELALIIDIGGGTSDFTILKLLPEGKGAEGGAEILANAGIHIGGTDFDRWLSLAEVMPHLGYQNPMSKAGRLMPVGFYHDLATWQFINRLYDHAVHTSLRQLRRDAQQPELIDRLIHLLDMREGHRLALEVEKAKIALSEEAQAHLPLDFIAKDLAVFLTRQALSEALADGTSRVKQTICQAFAAAGIGADQITSIFLTGGSTRIPALRSELIGLAPDASIIEGDAFGSVGTGLAIEAQRRFG